MIPKRRGGSAVLNVEGTRSDLATDSFNKVVA